GMRAQAFEVVEHLARERKQRTNGRAAIHAHRHKHAGGSFLEDQRVACCHGSGGMIKGLLAVGDLHRYAAKEPGDLARDLDGSRSTFDGEDAAVEWRNANTTEGL